MYRKDLKHNHRSSPDIGGLGILSQWYLCSPPPFPSFGLHLPARKDIIRKPFIMTPVTQNEVTPVDLYKVS